MPAMWLDAEVVQSCLGWNSSEMRWTKGPKQRQIGECVCVWGRIARVGRPTYSFKTDKIDSRNRYCSQT